MIKIRAPEAGGGCCAGRVEQSKEAGRREPELFEGVQGVGHTEIVEDCFRRTEVWEPRPV